MKLLKNMALIIALSSLSQVVAMDLPDIDFEDEVVAADEEIAGELLVFIGALHDHDVVNAAAALEEGINALLVASKDNNDVALALHEQLNAKFIELRDRLVGNVAQAGTIMRGGLYSLVLARAKVIGLANIDPIISDMLKTWGTVLTAQVEAASLLFHTQALVVVGVDSAAKAEALAVKKAEYQDKVLALEGLRGEVKAKKASVAAAKPLRTAAVKELVKQEAKLNTALLAIEDVISKTKAAIGNGDADAFLGV